MATQKQIEANRKNATKSHGPTSVEGKAASRMNALKSGIYADAEIIPGENPADLETLKTEYVQRFHPTTPEERHQVDVLIRDDWRLRRLARAESQLWEYPMRLIAASDKENSLGRVLVTTDGNFARLQRRINDIERSYREALRELERFQERPQPVAVQSSEAQPEHRPEPVAQLDEEETTSPAIGFVRPIPEPKYFMDGITLEELRHSVSPETDLAWNLRNEHVFNMK